MENEEIQAASKFALFNLGFRPFFLGAVLYAILSMIYWMCIYVFNFSPHLKSLSPVLWHAHEMVFGYGVAVITGFLLTAIKNWTGIQTLHGKSLLILFLLWLMARILAIAEHTFPFGWMVVMDCLFMIFLIYSISYPIFKSKKWKQLGILSKVIFLLLSNLLFYAGVLNNVMEWQQWGLYSGFYIIISLILVLGKRVIPFFIERGVDEPVQINSWKWLDILSLVLFIAFLVTDVFLKHMILTTVLAGLLFIIYSVRMMGWYTHGIWKKPLLWIIYFAYGWIVLGFGLKVAVFIFGVSPYLSIHAFAAGGIGMMTIGMMSRVTLGHTGRDVHHAPPVLFWIFIVLFAAVIVRVIFPLFQPVHYLIWIGLSQVLWIISFLVFLIVYFPIFTSPRIDGKSG